MYIITYFDTICIHSLEGTYSLFKMHTTKKSSTTHKNHAIILIIYYFKHLVDNSYLEIIRAEKFQLVCAKN